MNLPVIIRPEAEEDLTQAYLWYNEKRPGLGDEFLLKVEAALDLISENPDSNPIIYNGIRRKLIGRFPYAVFYVKNRKSISVLAVTHLKRHPKNYHR
jgi:toxin ParE1/3/4